MLWLPWLSIFGVFTINSTGSLLELMPSANTVHSMILWFVTLFPIKVIFEFIWQYNLRNGWSETYTCNPLSWTCWLVMSSVLTPLMNQATLEPLPSQSNVALSPMVIFLERGGFQISENHVIQNVIVPSSAKYNYIYHETNLLHCSNPQVIVTIRKRVWSEANIDHNSCWLIERSNWTEVNPMQQRLNGKLPTMLWIIIIVIYRVITNRVQTIVK